MSDPTDFRGLIGQVALALFGEPTSKTATEWRYGNKGSLCIDLEKDVWKDFETDEGGGVVTLVIYGEAANTNAESYQWLEAQGIVSSKGNGKLNGNGAFPDTFKPLIAETLVAQYEYTDEFGTPTIATWRYNPRRFSRHRWDGERWHRGGTSGLLTHPYKLLNILWSQPKELIIYIVEGEKDVDRLTSLRLIATTNIGGAGSWKPEINKWFDGRNVVILSDNDDAGRKHAQSVAKQLFGIASSIKIAELPGLPEKGDVSDWLDTNNDDRALLLKTIEEVARLVTPNPSRYLFETVADLRLLPTTKWLVRGWIPEETTGLLYGKWGAGKSFIVFDLALHMAYGMSDWHGAELPEGGCDVLVIAREGAQGFLQRIDAFKNQYNLTEDTTRIVFMRASVSFMRDEDFEGLLKAIEAKGRTFKFVIIDTVARVLPGAEMNKPEVITKFMERCSIVSALTRAAVVGIHHENKVGTMMGSIYFENNSDFIYEVTRADEEGESLTQAEITCTKMKDSIDGWKRTIRFKVVSLATIADMDRSSLVIDSLDGRAIKRDGLPPKEVCRRILEFIGKAWDEKKPLSHMYQAKAAGRYAQRIISAAFDVPPNQVERLIIAWLDESVLAIEIVNSATKMKGLRVIGAID